MTELIRLGLLADEMIVQPNIQNFPSEMALKKITIPEEYKPKKFLKQQKFIGHLSENTIEQVNTFSSINGLDGRNTCISVLIRFGLQYYNELEEKPPFDTVKQKIKTQKTLVLSNDEELFEELIAFQEEVGIGQRTIVVRYLLNLGLEYVKKQPYLA